MFVSNPGLMISGFAKAGQALSDDAMIARGVKAWRFVRQHMFLEDRNVLLRSCYVEDEGPVSQLLVHVKTRACVLTILMFKSSVH